MGQLKAVHTVGPQEMSALIFMDVVKRSVPVPVGPRTLWLPAIDSLLLGGN